MALEIWNVTKSFDGKKALEVIPLSIPAGAMVGVIGRSGAGKSTLLRAVNRLHDVTSGKIVFNGDDVTAKKGADVRRWRARSAMIFQQFNLAGRLDVMMNVLLGRLSQVSTARAALRMFSESDRRLAIAALELVEMADFAGQRAETLSGGQQQRAAIARALAQEPELILADEPVASLDPRNTRAVMDTLRSLNRNMGLTVLVSSHTSATINASRAATKPTSTQANAPNSLIQVESDARYAARAVITVGPPTNIQRDSRDSNRSRNLCSRSAMPQPCSFVESFYVSTMLGAFDT